MIEVIEKLLTLCPDASICGGDVILYKDGKNVSLGRTMPTTDGKGETTGTFVLSDEGREVLDTSAPVTRKPRNA